MLKKENMIIILFVYEKLKLIISEKFCGICLNIMFLKVNGEVKCLLVIFEKFGVGKSIVVLNVVIIYV